MNVEKEVAELRRMNVKELRERYAELFGDSSRSGNKAWLVKRLILRMQELAEGGLSERARRRSLEIANDADLRLSPPKQAAEPVKTSATFSQDKRLPTPGTVITRKYKGRQIEVRVLAKGFEYEGEVYRSLSAVAKQNTGTHTSGFLFFKLRKEDR